MRSIKITIPQYGAPAVEAIGFDGQGCTDATKVFEQALGSAVETREMKPEWANPASEGEAEQEQISW